MMAMQWYILEIESAKSDPVTVTRTQIGHGGAKQVSSEGKARATIGVDKEWVTAYRGDHVEVNVSTYAKYLEKFLPNPNTRGHVKGLEESGGFLVTAQSTPETARTGKTSGTIAMDQPLGPTVQLIMDAIMLVQVQMLAQPLTSLK